MTNEEIRVAVAGLMGYRYEPIFINGETMEIPVWRHASNEDAAFYLRTCGKEPRTVKCEQCGKRHKNPDYKL